MEDLGSGQKDAPNLLVISDLHLGDDIHPRRQAGRLNPLAMLERELQAFLDHYTQARLDGRLWRLIINGDMVDFLAMCVLPEESEGIFDTGTVDREERTYGLGTRPEAAALKMRRVLRRHPEVFRALARFVGAGNWLSVVAGNHDVEFHWPAVQETFRQGIVAYWKEESGALREKGRSPAELAAAISFHPWFYFIENVVWVEHGHQYDDYCSFDYVLNPVTPSKADEIVMNLGSAAMRYMGSQVGVADARQLEDWHFWGYLKFIYSQGLRGAWRLMRAYTTMALRLLALWRMIVKQPRAVEAQKHAHQLHLVDLAAQCQLSQETLLALDNLRQRPVAHNFAKLIMALLLDRLILLAGALLLVFVFVLALPWGAAFLGVGSILVFSWVANRFLSRARSPVDPVSKLRRVPEHIRRLVRTPIVVFGHSHEPVAINLDGGGWYFNTGTWVSTERPGLLRAFTHLMIRLGDDGPQAALYQWCDGQSQVFRG